MDCGERWGVFTAGMGVDGGSLPPSRPGGTGQGRHRDAGASAAVPTVLRSARREPTLTLRYPTAIR
jgi:hypothetical protein